MPHQLYHCKRQKRYHRKRVNYLSKHRQRTTHSLIAERAKYQKAWGKSGYYLLPILDKGLGDSGIPLRASPAARKEDKTPYQHPVTSEVCLPNKIIQNITNEFITPRRKTGTNVERYDMYLNSKSKDPMGSAVYIRWESVVVEGLDNMIKDGIKLKQFAHGFNLSLFSNKDFQRICKLKKAAGALAEIGFGSMNGSHTESIHSRKGQRSSIPFVRQYAEYAQTIGNNWAIIERAIFITLKKYYPDLLEEDGESEFSKELKSILSFGTVINDRSKQLFPYAARAFRLCGLPIKGSGNGKYTYNDEAAGWYEGEADQGNAPVHTDDDGEYKMGLPTFYMCFLQQNSNGTHYTSRKVHPFPCNDLLTFPSPKGGRGIRIHTMVPGYICIVFNRSRNLHIRYPAILAIAIGSLKLKYPLEAADP